MHIFTTKVVTGLMHDSKQSLTLYLLRSIKISLIDIIIQYIYLTSNSRK